MHSGTFIYILLAIIMADEKVYTCIHLGCWVIEYKRLYMALANELCPRTTLLLYISTGYYPVCICRAGVECLACEFVFV